MVFRRQTRQGPLPPQATDHLRRLGKLFEDYDKDKSGMLDFGELNELLKQIDSKLTSLPATAQRANQQGEYLGRKFNVLARKEEAFRINEIVDGDLDEAAYKAFSYRHMGSLAYIGNAAIFDFGGWNFGGGVGGGVFVAVSLLMGLRGLRGRVC